jgi:membrane fusion protein (multidrug efflux system)
MPSHIDQADQVVLPSANGRSPSHATVVETPPDSAAPVRIDLPKAEQPAAIVPASKSPWRKRLVIVGGLAVAVAAAYFGWPLVWNALNTISTDDAYVDGHVTMVAPRVPGQVIEVLVDDNYRVKRGDVLVRLDPEPYLVQLEIRRAAVVAAEADLADANARVRALVGQTHAERYSLLHAMELVRQQVANLKASVATYNSRRAELELARSNLVRGEQLAPSGGISKEDLDVRRQTVKVDEAQAEQALQAIHANRASLGLPAIPPAGHELGETPADLDQSFSAVREALAQLIETAAQLGYDTSHWNASPAQAVAGFSSQDANQLERVYAQIIKNAPQIKQAEAHLLQARRDLAQAELNLRYCTIVSDIDGVVTRRNVNPGNNVQAGEGLMAVRSLTEIWINANFKETQLADLRIGQRVRCEVDMYGDRRDFEGRITGFTMGTGQTLALLPPQNATGNFVKIVQRLPVRIELTDYDPNRQPLFVGLSVVPRVYYKEPPTGPHAGDMLQPNAPLPQSTPNPTVPAATATSLTARAGS